MITKRRRGAGVAVAAAVGALALAACSSSSSSAPPNNSESPSGGGGATGFNAAATAIVNPSDAKGGTLTMGATGDVDSYDPARTYYAWSWDVQRFFTRTLMAFQMAPGPDGLKVVPDMATGEPEVSSDGKTWTYKIQSGLKWDDGKPITTGDIKYGIERMWAQDVINGGPSAYYLCLLDTCDKDGNPEYQGPYKDPNGGLKSIETPDDTTIVFHLNQPYADFNYLMSQPATGPVPKARDTKGNYGQKPASSGPYMFQSFVPNSKTVWVRNPNWDPSTDKIRKALPDEIDLSIVSNATDLAKRVTSGDIDVIADGNIIATERQALESDPAKKAQVDNDSTSFIRYMAVPQTVGPLKNIDCRKALFLAFNKAAYIKIRGGSTGGALAGSMLPNGVPGYDPSYDPYPVGADGTGDVDAAKAALTACGQPNGFTIAMAYANTDPGPALFASVQDAMKRIGVTVTPAPADQANYYSTWIGSPQNLINKNIGLAIAAWGPDFPTATGFWGSIVDGRRITPTGNQNYSSLNDPVINNALDKLLVTTDPAESATLSTDINKAVMDSATYLPVQSDKYYYWRNSNVTNVYVSQGLGFFYDYVNLGVSS